MKFMTKLFCLVSGLTGLAVPFLVSAQTTREANFSYVTDLGEETASVITILLVLVVSVALLLFFWGLALFILKADDETERQKGRNIMIWGIIALAVIVSVWGLVEILQNLFGVEGSPTTATPPSVEGLPGAP